MPENTRELRIAEALAARLCHELVSPVGAIANGVEILAQDPDFAADATALIGQSAAQAACRLQYYRLAYGALAEIAPETARLAALAFFAEGRYRCIWPTAAIPGILVKPALNLLLLAVGALPRGGELVLEREPAGITVAASGPGARIGPALPSLFSADIGTDQIGAQTVQAIYTAALARRDGFAITVTEDRTDRVILRIFSQ